MGELQPIGNSNVTPRNVWWEEFGAGVDDSCCSKVKRFMTRIDFFYFHIHTPTRSEKRNIACMCGQRNLFIVCDRVVRVRAAGVHRIRKPVEDELPVALFYSFARTKNLI